MSTLDRLLLPMPIRVDASGPVDVPALVDTLASHEIGGLTHLDARGATLTRLVDIAGVLYPVRVTLDAFGASLWTPTTDEAINDELAGRVAEWFDFATDQTVVDAHFAGDPILGSQVAARPGVRRFRFAAPFEAVVLTVLGQQVSLGTAARFAGRLVSAYGPEGVGRLRGFPTPQRLADVWIHELRTVVGLTGARARTVRAVAQLFVDRGPEAGLPSRAELLAVPGIGPWTVDYLAIRAGTDPDAFPRTDAVLRRALRAVGDVTAIHADPQLHSPTAAVARWSPYRSYAACRLWTVAREAA